MDQGPDERRASLMRWGARCQRLGLQIAALGLIGGFAGVASRKLAGLTEAEQRASGSVTLLYWFFGVMFLTGLLVVLPAASIFYRRAGVVRQWDAKADDSDGGPEDAESAEVQREVLPRWFGWPLWAVVTIASLFLIYALLFHSLPSWFSRS